MIHSPRVLVLLSGFVAVLDSAGNAMTPTGQPEKAAAPARIPPSVEASTAEPICYIGAEQTDRRFYDGALRHAGWNETNTPRWDARRKTWPARISA